MKRTILAITIGLLPLLTLGQNQADKNAPPSRTDMDSAMAAMSSHHHDDAMGPHMKLTSLRAVQPGDTGRAAAIVETTRRVLEKYKDYRVALADGFQIFMPQLPQRMYHFTNYAYAREAQIRFNPEHPTSLLYEKENQGYRLIGAMFTAPAEFDEAALDRRIPLSIAQWHEHVNLCAPPAAQREDLLKPNPRFGLLGSIATQADCERAGGTFVPRLFGWMVHIYPYEPTPDKIWSVERQMQVAPAKPADDG